MATLDKLLKFLTVPNVAELIEEDKLKQIGKDVVKGFKIDEDSRADWLRTNEEAVKIIKNCSDQDDDRDGLYEGQSKVIFPLIGPAIHQLSSRLISHLVRNGKTVEIKVLGKDSPVIDPQSGQPVPGLYTKAEKARKVEQYMNYDVLIASKGVWIKDRHKLCNIVSGWGIGFIKIYYDNTLEKICEEVIPPKDVIVNQNITSLEKAPRVTIRHRLSKNNIIEQQRSGYFLDKDLEKLQLKPSEGVNVEEEIDPVFNFLCQDCYIDLDGDGYKEPWKVYVEENSEEVFCIVPAFEYKDISPDEKGKITKILRRLDVVDYHCLDDIEAGFYGFGLNALLLHPNKVLTTIERQITDAGLLANAAGVSGFVTKAFKTKERSIKVSLGRFDVLDCNPTVNPSDQVMQLPFKEPSQVLLNFFQLLIDVSKNQGFINDILTGDVEMQNVPATTTLAMTEAATRGFKPIIQKLYIAEQQIHTIRFHMNAKYLDKDKYMRFQDDEFAINSSDFDEESMDICPVADPTLSSDAIKYSRARALVDGLQVFGSVTNMQEAASRYYTDMGFNEPLKLIQNQPPQPDPKIVEAQMKTQLEQQKMQIEAQMEQQAMQFKAQLEQVKMMLKGQQQEVRAKDSAMKRIKTQADIITQEKQTDIQQQHADIARAKVKVDAEKVDVIRIAAQNKPEGNSNG